MNKLERYKDELEQLITTGERLQLTMQYKHQKERGEEDAFIKNLGAKAEAKKFLDNLPMFSEEYQIWYSEAKALVRQLLPDRLDDFVGYYEKPKGREEITRENYRISDYLSGLNIILSYPIKKSLGLNATIQQFDQQLAIIKAVRNRFESSLFDIKQIVQADLFDSELDAAKSLIRHGFLRPAGAIAGVVMEKHLAQVCENHAVKLRKNTPGIADFNEALKDKDVIDVPQWRSNQYLADIRNLCDHNKEAEPTNEQVTDLVDGVMKLTKTLF